jgi:dipeptidyl aminopeptidase/acylaminoacyl peptidase
MKPSDIADLASVSDPQLSPDGRHVAYVVGRVDEEANSYRSQIWVAPTDQSSPPRALTAGTDRDANPRWSPDGQQLAFTSSRSKDAKGATRSTVHLLPFGVPGETVLLADGDEGFGQPTFSPDGRWLALTHRTRGEHYAADEIGRRPARKIEHLFFTLNGEGFITDRPQHLYLVPTDGSGRLRNLTPGRHECSSPAWFPDGQRLAFEVNRFRTDFATDIAVLDIDESDASPTPTADADAGTSDDLVETNYRLLTDGTGYYASPKVTADGTTVVCVGYDGTDRYPQNAHLGLLDVDKVATPDWFTTSIDRTWEPFLGGSPVWAAGGTLLAAIEDRGNTHLYRVTPSVDAETPGAVTTGELTVTGWSVAERDGAEVLAYTATTRDQPPELFVQLDGQVTQLTSVSSTFVAKTKPRPGEHFLAPSDGHEVDAWIFRPHDFDPAKTYPALLNIHGGPFTQYGNYFFDEFQMQAEAGYVVLCSNPRGGSGREDAWGTAILGPKHRTPGTGWGAADYDDCMAVVDTALERFPFIDPARVGVLGGSYGGYLTSWIVTHTDRFAAACSERAVNNLVSLEYHSDIAGMFSSEIGPRFVDDPDEYRRMSPITYVKDLNTPLLIVHSEEDLRCPVDQATQLFVACQLLGKEDVDYWLFPGEDHELSRSGSPFHRKQRAEIILGFFDRYLT